MTRRTRALARTRSGKKTLHFLGELTLASLLLLVNGTLLAQETATSSPVDTSADTSESPATTVPIDWIGEEDLNFFKRLGINTDPSTSYDTVFGSEPVSDERCFKAYASYSDVLVVCLMRHVLASAVVWGEWDKDVAPANAPAVEDETPLPEQQTDIWRDPPFPCTDYPDGECPPDVDNADQQPDGFYIDTKGYLHDPYTGEVYAPIVSD